LREALKRDKSLLGIIERIEANLPRRKIQPRPLKTPEKFREFHRKLYQNAKQEKESNANCESLWKKIIGKPYSGKLNVRFLTRGSWK